MGSRVSLYADDLVLFVASSTSPDSQGSSYNLWLGVWSFSNLDKSMAIPLHCSEEDVSWVHDILSCQIEQFSCRYLGAPLSVRHLTRSDEQLLIDRVAATIPKWKGNLLNAARRSALAKVTMTSISTHMAIVLCLSPWAHWHLLTSYGGRLSGLAWIRCTAVAVRLHGKLFAGPGTFGGLALPICVMRGSCSASDGNGRHVPCTGRCCALPRGQSFLCFRRPRYSTSATASPHSFGLIIGFKVTASNQWLPPYLLLSMVERRRR